MPIETHLVDALGYERSWEDLRGNEARAFRDEHYRLLSDVEDEIERSSDSSARIRASVWFATPVELPLPSKEDILGTEGNAKMALLEIARTQLASATEDVADLIKAAVPAARIVPPTARGLGRAPIVHVEATADELRSIGQLDGITAIGLTSSTDEPASEAWYDIDEVPYIINQGNYDGTGVTVIDVLGSSGVGDSTHLGLKSGSCNPTNGPNYTCYCPAAAASAAPGGHMQDVLGIIKNNHGSLRGGAAAGATTIVGNTSGACSASHEDVIEWALHEENTNVVNRSASHSSGLARYLDWTATQSPFPTIVGAAANDGNAEVVATWLRNGLVVGAANDHDSTDRDDLTLATFSNGGNPNSEADGWELPHLVAPGVDISTVPSVPNGSLSVVDGTSYATPQVSGVAASMMEVDSALKHWPEAVFAIIMAGAKTNVHGVWPLHLSDGVDDWDGAGALSARQSFRIAQDKRDGGDAATANAHDYGYILAYNTPAESVYSEQWNAKADPGQTLRVAALIPTILTCEEPDRDTCSLEHRPRFALEIWWLSGQIWLSAKSDNLNNNYQYRAVTNTASTQRTYKIQIRMLDWDGAGSASFGVAWDVEGGA